MSEAPLKHQRPLSPHLQIYRPQITSVLSILHRMTGVFLSFGSVLLAVWLFGAAYDENLFLELSDFFTSVIGTGLLIAWSAAFYYHLCNGLRHLWWDIGRGLEIHEASRSGVFVLFSSAAMTAATWIAVWSEI
jgi:succinate dehydrogenase / fumarate reductase, cytochrome b subunit